MMQSENLERRQSLYILFFFLSTARLITGNVFFTK
jgi:hypothetical protein